jgi:uncharacterized repeat protein (TIGR03843 family)
MTDAPESIPLTIAQILESLQHGQMQERGILPYSSNYNFLVLIHHAGLSLAGVYKPRDGETPLWDFPAGTLCQRETAAFAISHALGWDLVPPTVLREGTRGIGSLQFYIESDPDVHYFSFREDARHAQRLRQLTLFDYMINNADRKSGHCLIGMDQQLWAIDHGICFHYQYKLRTVIWEFSREEIEPDLLADLSEVAGLLQDSESELSCSLSQLISPPEFLALQKRLAHLLLTQRYPSPLPHQRNFPWPPI